MPEYSSLCLSETVKFFTVKCKKGWVVYSCEKFCVISSKDWSQVMAGSKEFTLLQPLE